MLLTEFSDIRKNVFHQIVSFGFGVGEGAGDEQSDGVSSYRGRCFCVMFT